MITLRILCNDRPLFFCLAGKQVLPRLKDLLLLHVRRSALEVPLGSASGPMGASIKYLIEANNVPNNDYLLL